MNTGHHSQRSQFIEAITNNTVLASINFRKKNTICKNLPQHVYIDIGNVCNQFCRFCQAMVVDRNQQKIILSPEDFEDFSWLKYVSYITFSGNHGEVFANPRFPEIFRKIQSYAPYAQYGVYTNGAGLREENLYIVLKYFNTIHVSCNAITESSYQSMIQGGSFKNLMYNIEQVGKRKKDTTAFNISYVVTKNNASDVNNLIDFAARNNINSIRVHLGYYRSILRQSKNALPPESFLEDYAAYFDVNALKKEAESKNINVFFRTREAVYQNTQDCDLPWTNLYLGIVKGKPAMYICCGGGRPILSAKSFNDFSDIMRYWNHERMQHIRGMVNCKDIKTGMCAYCKNVHQAVVQTDEEIQKTINDYGVKEFDGEYRFYDELII